MRLRVRLHRQRADCNISLNYGYFLSGAIYDWIEKSSPAFASFLHDQGYHVPGTLKKFKHFCFSQLIVERREIDRSRRTMEIISPTIDWYISMPIENALQHLVVGHYCPIISQTNSIAYGDGVVERRVVCQ